MGLFYFTDPNQRFSDIKRKRESIEPIRQKWAKDRQFNNSLDEFKSQNRSQRKKVLFEEKLKNCFLLCFQDIQDKRFMKEPILSITVPVSYGTAR